MQILSPAYLHYGKERAGKEEAEWSGKCILLHTKGPRPFCSLLEGVHTHTQAHQVGFRVSHILSPISLQYIPCPISEVCYGTSLLSQLLREFRR